MKKPTLPVILALAAVAFAPAALGEEAQKEACTSLSAQVSKEVAAAPEKVLVIVAELIQANPSCSCEVVKAAIAASKADQDLIGEIVFTAVSAAPAESTTIAECAVAASPAAADSIKSALRRAMSDKNPVGKGYAGKGAVQQQQEEEFGDFGLSPVNIGGVYLVYPGGGATATSRLVRRDGRLVLIGPDGEVFVEEDDVRIVDRRPRRPRPIVIVVTPTDGDRE